jgi:hypothetical protein
VKASLVNQITSNEATRASRFKGGMGQIPAVG